MQKSVNKHSHLCVGDVLEVCKTFEDNTFDGLFSDFPYGLSFMGKEWDHGVPSVETCSELWRVLKPGAFGLVFGGTRTWHRLAVALEDAGFEIRDTLMWLYGCLSEDTEILTTHGWRTKDTIKMTDDVFSFDTKKHCLIKSSVCHIFKYDYEGEMVSLKNHNTDQLLTPNHKVVTRKGHRQLKGGKRNWYKEDEYNYKDAWQIRSNYYELPLASVYDGELSIGGDFAEILGWVISEGNYQKDTNAVNIYQSSVNMENVTRIRYCLGRAGIPYSEYCQERSYNGREYNAYQWYISGEWATKIKSIIPDKKPTWELLELKLSEKERLFQGLCGGDGSKAKNGKDKWQAFYQKDKAVLEWFQILLHLTGKQGWINHNKDCCSIHYNDSTQIQGKHHKDRLVKYKGVVWCIQTGHGNFIARRNGKVFITGNSGFPKSHDISKAIDKEAGAEREVVGIYKTPDGRDYTLEESCRQGYNKTELSMGKEKGVERRLKTAPATSEAIRWNGYGTALKPSFEPVLLIRKPLDGTNAQNALKWGTGGLNIDGCRIGVDSQDKNHRHNPSKGNGGENSIFGVGGHNGNLKPQGRWPANLILNESSGAILDEQSGDRGSKDPNPRNNKSKSTFSATAQGQFTTQGHNDSGGASRFFYCAKASSQERNAGLEGFEEKLAGGMQCRQDGSLDGKIVKAKNHHPTVKPLDLCRYLAKLIKPPYEDAKLLVPFSGSGSEMIGAMQAGWNDITGIELDSEYVKIAEARLKHWVEDIDISQSMSIIEDGETGEEVSDPPSESKLEEASVDFDDYMNAILGE